MNRPIKFRAWDDKGKKWLLGYDVGNLGGFSILGECVLFGEVAHVIKEDMDEKIDLKIMQFTGLQDKNGRDIYEGDLIKHEKITVRIDWFTSGYDAVGFAAIGLDGDKEYNIYYFARKGEVVGNIYQNSDLLP